MSNLAQRTEDSPQAPALAPGVDKPALSGAQKSLLFLVSLDERVATRILAHLSPEEVVSLRKASESLREVDPKAIAAVHEEFASKVQGGIPASLKGSGAYLRRIAGKALGEGKVAELWQDKKAAEGPVAKLSALDTPTILALIENEKPQTLAVVLSQFEPGRAADIVAQLPPEMQAELILRMARLQSIPEAVIEEIESQFADEIAALGEIKRREVKGIEAAANLVKRLDNELSETLIEELATLDGAVADELQQNLFTFEDLLRIDGRGMQQLLKEVATDQLVLALKSASEDVREKVFGNVSSRAANMLRDELDLLGPVKVSDVEEAQRAICQAALTLEQEGRIQIARDGGNDYV